MEGRQQVCHAENIRPTGAQQGLTPGFAGHSFYIKLTSIDPPFFYQKKRKEKPGIHRLIELLFS